MILGLVESMFGIAGADGYRLDIIQHQIESPIWRYPSAEGCTPLLIRRISAVVRELADLFAAG